MQIIREESPLWNRQLRLTLVQGLDTKYYLVSTIKYYSFDVIDGRPNYEVSVTEVDKNGNFQVLVQPHRKTFIERDPADKHHVMLLDQFDAFLKLQVPEPPKAAPAHAPAAPAPAPKAAAPAAQSPKSSGAQSPKSSAAQSPKSSGAQSPKSSSAPQSPKSSAAQAPKSSGPQAPKSSAPQSPKSSTPS